ncbi:MAG: PTS trehalose transporter subunit IIBC [Alphaproteobacteria bacterium]|jgi:PTS system trehalose-specific IIC component|nr:PTS trehalose transporter subunit IIBC [Alphaproteobacteria bacterium]
MHYDKEQSLKIVELIGGKDNIVSLMHCLTRLRFVLKDVNKADIKAIQQLTPTVKGVFNNAGQLHVIIGTDVDQYFIPFVKDNGLEDFIKAKEESKADAKQSMNPLERAVSYLADIFVPLLPAIIAGGMILGIRNVMELGGEMSPFAAGVHSFLWLIGEAIFHFLPVGVAWSVAVRMGTPPILGITLGITLVSPQLLNGWAISALRMGEINRADWLWDFGFFQMEKIGYQAQIIPALLAALFMCLLERNLRKIIPGFLYLLIVPIITIVVSVFLAHLIIGPVGRAIGDAVAIGVNFLLGGENPIFRAIGSAIFGFFYAPLVITGVHHTTNAIEMQMVHAFGGTPIFPLLALSNMAQGAAVMAVLLLSKRNKDLTLPAMFSAYFGVTEPAMFGVNLRLRYAFVCAMIGSSAGAVICGLFGVRAFGIGLGGLPAFLSVMPQYWVVYFIAMAVAIGVSFGLTAMIYKKHQLQGIDNGL